MARFRERQPHVTEEQMRSFTRKCIRRQVQHYFPFPVKSARNNYFYCVTLGGSSALFAVAKDSLSHCVSESGGQLQGHAASDGAATAGAAGFLPNRYLASPFVTCVFVTICATFEML